MTQMEKEILIQITCSVNEERSGQGLNFTEALLKKICECGHFLLASVLFKKDTLKEKKNRGEREERVCVHVLPLTSAGLGSH